MAQDRPAISRNRVYMLPLVVALPFFFLLFTIMEGWYLLAQVENEWDSGKGNVWQALQNARWTVGLFAVVGMLSGAGWAWVILRPLRWYKAQLDRLVEEGGSQPLLVDQQSEMSALAVSFNRVIQEIGRSLPHRAQAILETISSGVVLMDSGGIIDWANPIACRFFDIPPERIRGRGFREAFTWSEGLVALLQRALESGSDFPQETIQVTNRFGERRLVGARAGWVRDSDQKPVALVLTVIDLARVEAFSAGIRSAERLSSLGKLAAGIAHEVRNPLASIRGLAQLLSESEVVAPDKVLSYTKVIVSEVDRINRVVDRIAQLVSTQDEQLAMTPIRKIFDSVSEMSAHLARKKRIEVETCLEDDALAAPLRPQHMAQAVLNLVINAIEAAPSGGQVLLRGHGGDGGLVLEVENNGPGIPAREMDDLFQPFHTTKEQGTGLGLAITDTIVRDHGGRVTVQSGSNRTVFSVTLPGWDGTSNTESGESNGLERTACPDPDRG